MELTDGREGKTYPGAKEEAAIWSVFFRYFFIERNIQPFAIYHSSMSPSIACCTTHKPSVQQLIRQHSSFCEVA